jgi:Zn-dependent peptidase ImmA (M78 family)
LDTLGPWQTKGNKVMAVRRKHIRTVTERLLQAHGAKERPVPVERIVNALGLIVRRSPAEDDLSGFLYRDRESNNATIGINSTHQSNRQRFTLAHELGHFLLHDQDAIHVDRRFEIRLRNAKSSEGTDNEEKEANLFAAELLMPKGLIETDIAKVEQVDLEDEESLTRMAAEYGVSTQALIFRLAYLGHVHI